MNEKLRMDGEAIAGAAIAAVKPDAAVRRALGEMTFPGRVFLVAAGKAAWQMAKTAVEVLPQPLEGGIVVTKYGHVLGEIPGVRCVEAGHPVPDGNSFRGTAAVLEMTAGLLPTDTELQAVTPRLLAAGADIVEMNTVRKRLSAVKGGRFALHCAPARVEAVVLSDILGDPLDMIASGPAAADPSTAQQAVAIAKKYHLPLSGRGWELLEQETPKALDNVRTQVIGSVRELCRAAADACAQLGYRPVLLTDRMDGEAREVGRFLAAILAAHAGDGEKLAFLAGGETVVHLTGDGLGGRNQELALAAARGIAELPNAALISVGSDGTDGPTDAAGGYVDGDTLGELLAKGIDLDRTLGDNDAYHALQAVGGLVMTGPTGTNVNDVAVALLG